jgi:lactoylglutathione lyase
MMGAILVWSLTTKRPHAALLKNAGVATVNGGFLDFRDPWGNRIEIVGYDNIQFSKSQNVLRGMGLEQLTKNENAKQEPAKKGMA